MSKEKDLLAEIELQEAVIAEAAERLKTLRVEVYALRRETLRNKKPTPAMLDALARLAAGDGIYEYESKGDRSHRFLSTGDRVGGSVMIGLGDRECIQWRIEECSNWVARITDHGRAVLAKHQEDRALATMAGLVTRCGEDMQIERATATNGKRGH